MESDSSAQKDAPGTKRPHIDSQHTRAEKRRKKTMVRIILPVVFSHVTALQTPEAYNSFLVRQQLQQLSSQTDAAGAVDLLNEALSRGTNINAYMFNIVSNLCVSANMHDENVNLYQRLKHGQFVPNESTYTTVLRSICALHRKDDAIALLNEMRAAGIKARLRSYFPVGKLLAHLGDFQEILQLLGMILSGPYEPALREFSWVVEGAVNAKAYQHANYIISTLAKYVREVQGYFVLSGSDLTS